MRWIEHAIFWHVYPLGFAGAPVWEPDDAPEPRLARLLPWLDYAVELGASGLLLGPIFASTSHGYDTVDHFRIDPRLGSDEDFDALVTACHDRGLRVVLDGVFSHVGSEHPELQRVLSEADRSNQLFDIDWDADGGPTSRVFEGHGALARLNHGSDAAVELTTSVLRHWLERGIDGWRLDAAYSVPTEFWHRVLETVKPDYPEVWFVGEVIHGDYAGFVEASGVDSVTQYELWKAIWSSITDQNFFELDWALQRHNDFLETFQPQTFIGNHDVNRIATAIGPDAAVLALALLMTVGGIPSIYYGDEQGFVGVKEERFGGDDAIRPAFPDTPADLADWGAEMLRAHQDLIGLRRRHPWLTHAVTSAVELTNQRYVYTTSSGEESLQVELSLEDGAHAVIRQPSGEVLWSR